MRNRHQEALKKSAMLGHASQTSGLMQNVHDKCLNLPDPDIFTVDTVLRQMVNFTSAGTLVGSHSETYELQKYRIRTRINALQISISSA